GARSRSSLSSLNSSIGRWQPYLSSSVPPGDDSVSWLDTGATQRLGGMDYSLLGPGANTLYRASAEKSLIGAGSPGPIAPLGVAGTPPQQQQQQQQGAALLTGHCHGAPAGPLSGVTFPAAVDGECSKMSSISHGQGSTAQFVRWHEVHVKPVDDPISGERVIMVIQTDVSNQVHAEEVLTRVLEAEQRLLADIFPRHVVRHMTAARNATAERQRKGLQLLRHIQDPAALATSHECITVLFADIKGFTEMCKEVAPATVMTFLNDLYTRLDSLTDVYGVYKVETIGDCYMVAGGLMARDEDGYGQAVRTQEDADPLHATRVVAFARAMLGEAARVRLPNTGRKVQMRIGIHSGPATSGVVGQKMPRFCLFGDTVNTASRMESTGRPGCIHASASTRALLKAGEEEIGWVATGGVEVKGKGRMETYLWAPQSEGATRQRRDMKQRAMVLGTLPDIREALITTCTAAEVEADAAALTATAVLTATVRTANPLTASTKAAEGDNAPYTAGTIVSATPTAVVAAAAAACIAGASAASTIGGGGSVLPIISEVTSNAGSLKSSTQQDCGQGSGTPMPSISMVAAAMTPLPHPLSTAPDYPRNGHPLGPQPGSLRDCSAGATAAATWKPLMRTYSALESVISGTISRSGSRRLTDRK
ncbi:hypothetical protein Vafri_21023, partial [Volvox africanus]